MIMNIMHVLLILCEHLNKRLLYYSEILYKIQHKNLYLSSMIKIAT